MPSISCSHLRIQRHALAPRVHCNFREYSRSWKNLFHLFITLSENNKKKETLFIITLSLAGLRQQIQPQFMKACKTRDPKDFGEDVKLVSCIDGGGERSLVFQLTSLVSFSKNNSKFMALVWFLFLPFTYCNNQEFHLNSIFNKRSRIYIYVINMCTPNTQG